MADNKVSTVTSGNFYLSTGSYSCCLEVGVATEQTDPGVVST